MHPRSLLPGILSLVSSVTGATFAAISTQDYAKHLDRQLHGTHCSFIPGAGAATPPLRRSNVAACPTKRG